MEEHSIKGQYKIVGFVDDMEWAVMQARKKDIIPKEILEEIVGLHGDLIEMEPYLMEQEDYDTLNSTLQGPVDQLVETCRNHDAKGTAEVVTQLRQCIEDLKQTLMG